MTKPTPGPWFVKHEYNVFAEATGRLVASTGGHSSSVDGARVVAENVANARLVAAAPDLLNALEQCAAVMKAEGKGDDDAEYTNALAAIKKARGEP